MRLRGIRFRYPGSGFELGPLDVEGPDNRPWLILGGTGSGKTTLLRLLGGSARATAGEMTSVGESRGYLPQLPERVLGGRNLAEDLSGVLKPDGGLRSRLRNALKEAGLQGIPLSRRSRELSQGERRRVALALLFLSGRHHWALDEPEAGLDARARDHLLAVLRTHPPGRRLWLATHHFEWYSVLDPWVVVLEKGRLLAAGNPKKVMELAAVRTALSLSSRAPGRLWANLGERLPGARQTSLPGPPPEGGGLAQIHALLMDRTGV